MPLDKAFGIARGWSIANNQGGSPVDTTPDTFTFVDIESAETAREYTSDPVTISGINAPTPITVTGGLAGINGGAFSAAPPAANNGDQIRLRRNSSNQASTAANVMINVGGVVDTWTITTAAAASDTTPDPFSFTNVTNASPSTLYESNPITVAGINAPTPISVSVGGQYSKNSGAWTSANGTVVVGDVVLVRRESSADPETPVNATLTIGGEAATFTITTAPVSAPAVSQVVSVAGDSWTEGNQAIISRDNTSHPEDLWDFQLAELLGVQKYAQPGQTGITEGVINVGYGGQTSQTIVANLSAIIDTNPARKEDTWSFWGGRNNVGSEANVEAHLTAAAAFVAKIDTHERKLLLVPSLGGSIIASTADWVRGYAVRNQYWRNWRKLTFNHQRYWWGLAPNGSDGSATDDGDVSRQALITSLRVSAGSDQAHPNWRSSPKIAAAMEKVVRGLQHKAVYVLEQTIPDVRYDLPEGQSLEVYFKGWVSACSIAADDPVNPGLFTIAMKPGSKDTALLTRTAVSPGVISGVLNLRIKADGVDTSGAPRTHTNDVRILPSIIGAASTLPVGARLVRDPNADAANRRWPRLSAVTSPFANGPALTFVACIAPEEDGTNMNLGILGTNVIINRSSGNKLAIVIRDTSNTIRLNWTTLTTNFNAAGGLTWVAFSIDLATLAAVAYSGRAAGDVSIAAASAPSAGAAPIALAAAAPHFFVASASGASSYVGGVKMLWMAARFIDFSVEANRRKFWNADGSPVDLGADGSTGLDTPPEIYLPGAPGDYVMGTNFGSGPDLAFHDNWLSGQASSDPLPLAV